MVDERWTVPPFRDPVTAVVEYVGKPWPARLGDRGPHEAVLECRLRTSIGSIILVRLLAPTGVREWLTLECAVRAVMAPPSSADGFSTYLVRWRWAYCPQGVEALRERVAWLSGQRGFDLEPSRSLLVDAGALYAFDPDALRYAERTLARAFVPLHGGTFPDGGPSSALPLASSRGSRAPIRGPGPAFRTTLRLHRPFARLRAQERVRVDLPCRYVASDREMSGWLRDLSRSGAFVSTRWTFPPVGSRVIVSFSTALDGHRRRFVLTGVTRRVNDDRNAPPPPGFGVEVESIVDGEKGHAFQRYLDRMMSGVASDDGVAEDDAVSSENADGRRT